MRKTYTLVERNEAIAKMLGWKQYHLDLDGATYWVDLNGEPFAMPFFNCDWNKLMSVVEHIKYKYHWKVTSHQFIDDELTAENDNVNVYTGEYWCMIHNSTEFASRIPLIDVCGKPTELLAVFTACSDFALLEDKLKIC